MKYVIGAAVGLLWGALIAWVNYRISRKAVEQNSEKMLLTTNFVRTLLDIAALAAVFLLRNVLPFSFEAAICATAAALGLLTVVFAFQLSRPVKKAEAAEQRRENPHTPEQEQQLGSSGSPQE